MVIGTSDFEQTEEEKRYEATWQYIRKWDRMLTADNWLVNKAKVEPKTVQGILRHSKIQATLDLYTQEDSDEARAAQGRFLTAVGVTERIQ